MTFNDYGATVPNIRVRYTEANILHYNTATKPGTSKSYGYWNLDTLINGLAADGKPFLPDFIGINEGTGNGQALLQICDDNPDYALAAEGIDPNCPAGQWAATQTWSDTHNKTPIIFSRKFFDFVSYEVKTLHGPVPVTDPSDPDYPNTITDQYASFLTLTTKPSTVDMAGHGGPLTKTIVIANVHVDRGWCSNGSKTDTVRGNLGEQDCIDFHDRVMQLKTGEAAVLWGGDINVDFYSSKSANDPEGAYVIFRKGDSATNYAAGKGMIPIFDELSVPNDSKSITHAGTEPSAGFPGDGSKADFSSGSTLDWIGKCYSDGKVHAKTGSFQTVLMPGSDHKGVYGVYHMDY